MAAAAAATACGHDHPDSPTPAPVYRRQFEQKETAIRARRDSRASRRGAGEWNVSQLIFPLLLVVCSIADYRKDFGPLITKPLHLDLEFDIHEEAIRVTSRTTFLHTADEPLQRLQLNSKELEIHSVELLTGFAPLSSGKPSSADFVSHVASFDKAAATPLKFEVDTVGHFLNIDLSAAPWTKGQQYVVRTVSTAKPTSHILEGFYYGSDTITQDAHTGTRLLPAHRPVLFLALYFSLLSSDWTPKDAPKTIITSAHIRAAAQRCVRGNAMRNAG